MAPLGAAALPIASPRSNARTEWAKKVSKGVAKCRTRQYDALHRLRGGAVWQLVGLITRRSQVQILPPLPTSLLYPPSLFENPSLPESCCRSAAWPVAASLRLSGAPCRVGAWSLSGQVTPRYRDTLHRRDCDVSKKQEQTPCFSRGEAQDFVLVRLAVYNPGLMVREVLRGAGNAYRSSTEPCAGRASRREGRWPSFCLWRFVVEQ